MASINKVILVGNLGRDPETREIGDNSVLTSMSLATTRRYKNRDGENVDETEWHRIVFFGRTAEIARDFLKKGSQAYVEGRLRTRRYQDKDGIERYVTEIVGETLQLLDRRNADQQSVSDGFTSAPRARTQPASRPQAPQQPAAPAPAAQGIDGIEEDIPF